jgi:hypothetical protein
MKKENWERKLFYLLTPALMGDPFMCAEDGLWTGNFIVPSAFTGLSKTASPCRQRQPQRIPCEAASLSFWMRAGLRRR